MKVSSKFIAAAVALVCSLGMTAQNNTVTPYSRFGYGVLNDNVSASQRAMGSVGYAMNNGRQINVMNPASYASIDTLTFLFDMGVTGKYLSTSDGDQKGHRTTAGLDYVTMQFPLSRYIGGSIGLLPYSSVGYSFGEKIVNGESSYQGSGNINQLYVGVGARPVKGLTLGANLSYLFGTLLNDTYMAATGSTTSLFERVIEVRDYDVRLGVQYAMEIGRRHRVTVGAVYSPGKSFLGHAYGVYYDMSTSAAKADTVGYTSLRGNYTRPATIGAGVNYQYGNRLMVEADVTYQPWKDAKIGNIEGFETTRLCDRWKVAAGLQYIPDPRGSYFKRINYRLGGYYNRDYIMVGDNNVNDIGITCGFGLPAPVNRWTKTVVNIGFEYRHRRSSPMALVKEDYFQITLGINFNELWFWQNKIQ